MPLCIVCDSKFSNWSYSSPAEPCDCGQCYTRDDWQDAEPGDLDARRESARISAEMDDTDAPNCSKCALPLQWHRRDENDLWSCTTAENKYVNDQEK